MTDEEVPSTQEEHYLTEDGSAQETVSTDKQEEDNLPSEGEWRVARKYLIKSGESSSLFTSCSRNLVQCAMSGDGKINKATTSQVSRLLKSPSMLAQVFYAAKTYYFKDIASRGAVEPGDFVSFIAPYEIATIITVGYTTRRIAHMLDKHDWEMLWDPYQRYADLSMPLGFAIPAIGPTRALMAAAGKFLAWGIFNCIDQENFKKYRIANKQANRCYNLAEELKIFGTTHLHIAALIWQKFGYGVQVSEDYFAGLSESSIEELSPTAIRFRVARLWLESLLENGQPPTQDLGDDYELVDSRSEKFIEIFESIKTNGSEYKWLLRNRDDIGEDKTPDLFADFEGMKKILKKRGRKGPKEAIINNKEE